MISQKEFIGFDSIKQLENILYKYRPKKIFLSTGRASYEKCGAKDILEPMLDRFSLVRFSPMDKIPVIEDIERGIEIFNNQHCDFVIAIGGGNVMDTAKSVNLLSSNTGRLGDYLLKKKRISHKGKPLIAIPTTAGTGSEATRFGVVYMEKKKYSLEHDFLLPDYVILDPQLTMTLPKYITASTGIDVLCQAIESYWSIHSTETSKSYAKEAIKIVTANICDVTNHPSRKSRDLLLRAANLAGKAINLSKTTACHAISYPMTSFFGIPHGHAVALTLGAMLEYNYHVAEEDLLDHRGKGYVENIMKELFSLLGVKGSVEANHKIRDMMIAVGLEFRLSRLGIKNNEDTELIIKNGFNPDRVNNNPRKLTERALRNILKEIN